MIDRTVLIKFAEWTTDEQLNEVIKRFKALKDNLTGIVDLQAGLNMQEKSKEYQVVLSVRFENIAALDAYVANEQHQAVATYIKEIGRVDSIGVDIEI
ncbi:Dabb family protein [Bacillus suaedae]|uniref:Dabb family protein n=1 Tax=Halalkalibacter suaedae TaxID=2822140 RepID=A0A940WYP2_9BACI|nr:Dabb family protein [Bacillus suaedae]MBP3950499.1 Dabb family protein [Bacillus suaedae]